MPWQSRESSFCGTGTKDAKHATSSKQTELPDCESCFENDDTYAGDDELLQTVDSEEILVAGAQKQKERHKRSIVTKIKGENDKLIEFQVDTGASCIVLTRQDLPGGKQMMPVFWNAFFLQWHKGLKRR